MLSVSGQCGGSSAVSLPYVTSMCLVERFLAATPGHPSHPPPLSNAVVKLGVGYGSLVACDLYGRISYYVKALFAWELE